MKKIFFQVLKLSVLIVLLCLFANSVKAQTFVCTDVTLYNTNKTDEQVQKLKREGLGSTCVLELFDNSLKLTYTEKNGEKGSIVFNKISDTKYQYKRQILGNRYEKGVIELQKWVAYIKSFTFSAYDNEKLEMVVTFKRK